MHRERDASNFDFRVVALMTVVVTRPDLLHEYIVDGRDKDEHKVPLALNDDSKWKRLRHLGFPPEMLAQMYFLFDDQGQDANQDAHSGEHDHGCHEIAKALVTMQRLFRTMVAIDFYCEENCPDNESLEQYIASTARIRQTLSPAGVEVKKESHAEDYERQSA